MKKTLYLVSIILFNICVVLFALTMIIWAVSGNLTSVFDDIFGGATTEVVAVSAADEDTIYFKSWYNNVADLLDGNDAVSAAAVAEGSVLLKNDNNALPLAEGDKVSLFGVTAYDPIYTMNGGATKVVPNTDRKQYFRDTMEAAGLEVNSGLADWYNSNSGTYFHVDTTTTPNGWMAQLKDAPWSDVEASGKVPASGGGTAVFVFGRSGNEATDIPPYGGTQGGGVPGGVTSASQEYLSLTDNEKSVLAGLKEAKAANRFQKTVVIINATNVMQEHWPNIFANYNVDAALWIGTPGTGGLPGVASLLAGKSNPSGRLTDMWYSAGPNNPSSANFNASSTSGHSHTYVLYQEGVYVGYRYAETRYEDYVLGTPNAGSYDYAAQVSYPFGYGNSYTTFEYTGMQVTAPSAQDGEYKVNVTVKNTGTVYSGKEAVQVYLQKPYTQYDKNNNIEKPSVELVGFGKTGKLAPDASETVEIKIDANRYFADFDAYDKGTYILEAGNYYLTAAKNSHDAVNNFLAKKIENGGIPANTGDKMDDNGKAALVHQINITSTTENNYAYETNTGKEAKELFAHADPNKCDPSATEVTFMSRNNWNSTVKSERTIVAGSTKRCADRAYDKNQKVVEDENAEYPTYGAKGNGEEYIPLIKLRIDDKGDKIPYDDPRWKTFLDQLSWEESVHLLSHGWRKTVAIQSVAKPDVSSPNGPLGFRENYINGNGQLSGFAKNTNDPDGSKAGLGYPHHSIIAGTFNTELMYAVGQAYGEDALWAGHAGMFGLGLNLHRNPYGGRNGEYFSDDSFLAGITAGWMTKGIQSKGCHVYNKHFALNEMDHYRTSPYETWITEQTFRQHYLRVWETAIQIGDASNVMLAFSRIGSRVSCANTNLLTDYLRGECGMKGYAITDGTYNTGYGHGMVQGVLSGLDLPDGDCGSSSYNKDGSITIGTNNEFYGKGPESGGYGHVAQGMRESVHRIMYITVHSNAMNYFGTGTKIIVHPATWGNMLNILVITVSIVFGISAAFAGTMLVIRIVDKRKIKAKNAT